MTKFKAKTGSGVRFSGFGECFFLDAGHAALQYEPQDEAGSSSCRVTGVSSLNLARRPQGLAGFFLFG